MTTESKEQQTINVEPNSVQTGLPTQLPAAKPALPRPAFDYTPTSLDSALRIAELMADSDLVPKDYRNKSANVFVAMQWGHEIGLKPMQAVQNIAVINGRPGLWGDAMLALVRSSPLCEYVREEFDLGSNTAICRVKRRGDIEQNRQFSQEDARVAGLLGRDNTHKTYPKRMLQMRARSWALRDVFTDVLRGMPMAEELLEILAHQEPTTPSGPLVPLPQSTEGSALPPDNAAKNDGAKKTKDSAATHAVAPPSMIALIKARMHGAALSTEDLRKRFPAVTDPESLDGISVQVGNEVLRWIGNPAEN